VSQLWWLCVNDTSTCCVCSTDSRICLALVRGTELEYMMCRTGLRIASTRTGFGQERTFLSTIMRIRNIIEDSVIPTIKTEILHSSARDHLQVCCSNYGLCTMLIAKQVLESKGTDLVLHTVQFLFFVLRDTNKNPPECTIDTLRRPHSYAMRGAMSAQSGTSGTRHWAGRPRRLL
jgi:hypothetical protein